MPNQLTNIFQTQIGAIHFVGIGGIGMSGIAEILHSLGYTVQGSDMQESYVTDRLKTVGIEVFFPNEAKNVEGCSLVVRSTDIKDDNPEIVRARELGIPTIKRSEMLAEIMRFKHSIAISGTHGKTTTTSLVAHLLDVARLDPTVINGGVINHKKTNAYVGSGPYLVAEADESDGTFIKIPSYVAIVTNIDPEHLNYYHTFEASIAAYRTFVTGIPFYGFAVLCYDHPIVRELGKSIKERRIISYGIETAGVDLRAVNIKVDMNGSTFDVELSDSYVNAKQLKTNVIKGVKLSLKGEHNVSNALSAIAVGIELGISQEVIVNAFYNFEGVKRRFTKTGEVDGVTIVDDYAHHPVEIMATLKAARAVVGSTGGKVIAVVQPHRYSRLADLMDEFSTSFKSADELIISDVYSAGETPIPGITSEELIRRVKLNTKQTPIYLRDRKDLPEVINNLAKRGDIVVLLGAGDITKWAYELPNNLKELQKIAS